MSGWADILCTMLAGWLAGNVIFGVPFALWFYFRIARSEP